MVYLCVDGGIMYDIICFKFPFFSAGLFFYFIFFLFIFLCGPVFLFSASALLCLQCFDAVGWAAGRASGL